MEKRKSKLILSAVLILALCFAVFIISGLTGERRASIRYDTIPIKANDEYMDVCVAETISQAGNINTPFDLKEKISEKKFKKEIYGFIYGDVNEIPTSKLYGADGFYLSVCGAATFDIPSNRTGNMVQCFIFTKDLEEAGVINFNKEVTSVKISSVSINDTALGTRSTVPEKLSENKNNKYVILKNGLETKLLDEENNVTNVGSSRHKLEIDGDCYGALKALSISYNEITDSENLIWFKIDELK